MNQITLTPAEARNLRDLLSQAMRLTRGPQSLRPYNLCRRALVIICNADRRRFRIKHATNHLLTEPEIVNEIFN